MLVNNVEKTGYSLKIFVSKLNNFEGAVIAAMVETLLKYLISSVICVGVLQLFD